VTPSAVIQVKPGIGDVIWHLPFIRAIAAASPGGTVTFLAPPTSGAKELLAAEPGVAETIYFAHGGSELMRGVNLIRLVALLRRQRFHAIWILDRTLRPAVAAMLVGIPERIGLGIGAQERFITNPGIDPRPWIALGIGASHPDKDWPDRHWAEFVKMLRRQTTGTVFLLGGRANTARAQDFIVRSAGASTVNACDLGLMEAAALLHHADLFVGPSSGPLNLAAATATEAFGLFGSTPVLTYSKFIRAIVPDGGPSLGGMERIFPAQVIERIAPSLS
jgi:heptosyltransferase-2